MVFDITKIKNLKNNNDKEENLKENKQTDNIEKSLFNNNKIANFLEQDISKLSKISLEDSSFIEDNEIDARYKAIQIMNVIKLLSPAINIAMNEEEEELAQIQLFNKVVEYSSKMALETGRLLGANEKQKTDKWIFNYLESIFAENLKNNKYLSHDINIELLKSVIKKANENRESEINYIKLPNEVSLNLSLIKALTPIIVEQEKFSFFRDKEKDKDMFFDLIYESCSSVISEMLEPLAKEEERVLLFKNLAEESGKILANAWGLESKKIIKELKNKSSQEIDIIMSMNPEGLSLEKVISRYKSQFRRLTSLCKQIKIAKK